MEITFSKYKPSLNQVCACVFSRVYVCVCLHDVIFKGIELVQPPQVCSQVCFRTSGRKEETLHRYSVQRSCRKKKVFIRHLFLCAERRIGQQTYQNQISFPTRKKTKQDQYIASSPLCNTLPELDIHTRSNIPGTKVRSSFAIWWD